MVQREEQLKAEIGERLQWALERQGPEPRSIRWLEAEMGQRDADITSYGAIRSYVKGEKLPPITFLEEAADALAVRREWLVLGEGEMTSAEEDLREQGAERLLADHPQLRQWPSRMRGIFVELLAAYGLQAPQAEAVLPGGDIGSEQVAGLERDLVFLVTLPLQCWGFRDFEDLSVRERYNYLLNMLGALLVSVKSRARGDSLEDHAESLLPALRRAAEEPPELTQAERERAERLQAEIGEKT